MAGIVRGVIILPLIVALIVWGRNRSRKVRSLGALAIIAIVVVIELFPVENLFVTFPDVSSACEYLGAGKIRTVVEGNETVYVETIKDDYRSSQVHILQKDDQGIKLRGSLLGRKIIRNEVLISGGNAKYWVIISKIAGSNDYYVNISSIDLEKLSIKDAYNTVFVQTEWQEEGPRYDYAGFIYDLSLPYTVEIDGVGYFVE